MTLQSKENLPSLGVVAASVGTLARRGALLLHIWLPSLLRELSHSASHIPIKHLVVLYFMLC